jgi:hypothetical protein
MLALLLFLLAVIVGIYGIVLLVKGSIILGIVLLIVACLIGPGGYSVFNR